MAGQMRPWAANRALSFIYTCFNVLRRIKLTCDNKPSSSARVSFLMNDALVKSAPDRLNTLSVKRGTWTRQHKVSHEYLDTSTFYTRKWMALATLLWVNKSTSIYRFDCTPVDVSSVIRLKYLDNSLVHNFYNTHDFIYIQMSQK
jgi:hypothetical protein